MLEEPILELIVGLAAFLELSDEETLNLDAAAKQMESMAYLLNRLPTADVDQLIGYVQRRAADEQHAEVRRFLEQFPEAFGLTAGQTGQSGAPDSS
jgi:hypothetical protein